MPVNPSADAPSASPTIRDVQSRVFEPICASCHSGSRPPGDLRLGRGVDAAALRDYLIHKPSSATGMPYVTPGEPTKSFLMHKLEGTQSALNCPTRRGCGMRMPPSGPLGRDKLELVRRWITEGAR